MHTTISSPIGPLRLTLDDDGAVAGIGFAPGARTGDAGGDPRVERLAVQLREYFAGKRAGFDLPLRPRGSALERRVWDELLRIPYGETATYAEIASRIGRPGAARAVGRANARNPIAIAIPCHRVVGSDGSLTGYAGGLQCKRSLLALEAAAAAKTASPAEVRR
jgi:methylated-DNA-[protein]-cysteine S-methyltransferase